MRFFISFLLTVCFLFSCTNASEEDLINIENPEVITYVEHIKPIIDNNCIICHGNPPASGASISLTTYDEVVSAINSNELIDRISRQPGEAGAMPLGGPRLPQHLIDLMIQWEEEGFVNE
ncbi:hypothetical protein [Mesonia sp. K7]|uniref:hypothetical protein n=1 Tax=Mesonia sp. K7 TaxID=2218606 RepID=UPI000DA91EB4|nr:hypothetical protein [Mesonia sp. K7]PZD77893.1 hypothetical protein DNG35_07305 [Mesonia sp. K7]